MTPSGVQRALSAGQQGPSSLSASLHAATIELAPSSETPIFAAATQETPLDCLALLASGLMLGGPTGL